MKKILSILILLALVASAHSQTEAKRILFVGNSYIYVNDLPSMIKQFAASAGDLLIYDQVTTGGASFAQHCTSTGAMASICSGGWDFVVLQAQSQEPSFPWAQFSAQTYPYACQLADSVYAHNDCPEIVFYMTWGRKNGDASNAPYFDSLATYIGMDNLLYERYMYMARQNNASVSPVGRVWRKLRAEHPELELYQSDESHPSLIGSYAATCAFYTILFRHNPLLVNNPLSLDSATALIVRQAAKEVVFDSLYLYSSHAFYSAVPEADSLCWQFSYLSSSSPEFCQWNFGDSFLSSDLSPRHCFSAPGSYTISLVAGKLCNLDTLVFSIQVPDTSSSSNPVSILSPDNTTPSISLFPNPANSLISVSVSSPSTLSIYDPSGRTMFQTFITHSQSLDISFLPRGIYFAAIPGSRPIKFFKL